MNDEKRMEIADQNRPAKGVKLRWVEAGGERRYMDAPPHEIADMLRAKSKLGEREAKLRKAEARG